VRSATTRTAPLFGSNPPLPLNARALRFLLLPLANQLQPLGLSTRTISLRIPPSLHTRANASLPALINAAPLPLRARLTLPALTLKASRLVTHRAPHSAFNAGGHARVIEAPKP
jgi:hypothetical protein